MILIASKRQEEVSTNEVILWLRYKEKGFTRINGEDFLDNISYDLEDSSLAKEITKEIKSCWFRRSFEASYIENKIVDFGGSNNNSIELFNHLNKELRILNKTLFRDLSYAKWLSHPSRLAFDKIQVLKVAKSLGLKIPPTFITSEKKDLFSFLKKNNSDLRTKPISEVPFFSGDNEHYSLKTVLIGEDEVSKMPERFFPSLFQKHIHKKFELRIFYLDGDFYTMAIFSQNDPKTMVDFRNYNDDKPNRVVPYKLPEDIKEKLTKLMTQFKLETGSIDIMVNLENEYIFLEINPAGQFGMTSFPCNYNLEEKIADYLIKNDE